MREFNPSSQDARKWFDLPFILRKIRLWWFPFLCASIVVAVLVYVGSDYLLKDTFRAEALVAVTARDNKITSIADSSIESAVTRNENMWNSHILITAIQNANPTMPIRGSLSAAAVGTTGLVRVSARANSAQDAYYLLNAAIQNYRQVSANFDTDYYPVVLTTINSSCITRTAVSSVRYGLLGFAGMLFVCLAALVCWTLFTDILHGENQAKELLAVPLYECLSSVRVSGKKKNALLTRKDLPIDYLEGLDLLVSRVEQHMLNRKQKMMLVTSVSESEGKSTVSSNIALSLARRGRKVLLVDMDLRRPNLWNLFGKKKTESNSYISALKHGGKIRDAIEVCPELWKLNVLWQYRPIQEADSYLENSDLKKQLSELRAEYDYIIIDSPPMGIVRDAAVISRMAECSLLIIQQDRAHASIANDITDELEENGSPCMGAVLNNCRGRRRIYRLHGTSADRSRKGGGR